MIAQRCAAALKLTFILDVAIVVGFGISEVEDVVEVLLAEPLTCKTKCTIYLLAVSIVLFREVLM